MNLERRGIYERVFFADVIGDLLMVIKDVKRKCKGKI